MPDRGGFLLTYVNLTYDATDSATGTGKVRQKAQLNAAGDRYTGSGDFTYYDTTGTKVAGGAFTVTARRIDVRAPR